MAHRGPKKGGQRAKTAKHLRASSQKKFKNDSIEARTKYASKMAARANRKLKRKKK